MSSKPNVEMCDDLPHMMGLPQGEPMNEEIEFLPPCLNQECEFCGLSTRVYYDTIINAYMCRGCMRRC